MSDKNLPKVRDAGRLFDPSASTPMIGRGIERLERLQRSTQPVQNSEAFESLWTFTASLSDVRRPAHWLIQSLRVSQDILFVEWKSLGGYSSSDDTLLDPETGGPTSRVYDWRKRIVHFSSGQEARKRAEDLGITFRFYDETFERAFDQNEDDDGDYNYVSLVRGVESGSPQTAAHPSPALWEVPIGLVDDRLNDDYWKQEPECWTRGATAYAFLHYPRRGLAVETESGRVLWRSEHEDFALRFEDEKTWLISELVPQQGGDVNAAMEHQTAGISAQTGRIRWSVPGHVFGLNTAHRVVIFQTGSILEGRDLDTGVSRWTRTLTPHSEATDNRRPVNNSFDVPSDERQDEPSWAWWEDGHIACSDRHVFVLDEVRGQLDAVDQATGSVVWSTTVESPIVDITIDAGRLFVATASQVYAFSIPV